MGKLVKAPPDLWSETRLCLPRDLVGAYRARLIARNLLVQAQTRCSDGDLVVGGFSPVEAEQHFCHRFPVCAGRAEYVCLDPGCDFDDAHKALIAGLADGRVTILDMPGGAGAAGAAIVGTLIQLRRQSILPALPLDLDLFAADISPTSLEIYKDLIGDLTGVADSVGIRVRCKTRQWDAMHPDQTSAMVDDWLSFSSGAEEHFVLVSNFSGALKGSIDRAKFERSLQHILERVHDKCCNLIWVEPAMNRVLESLFPWVYGVLAKMPWFRNISAPRSIPLAQYYLLEPILEDTHTSSVTIQRFQTVGFGL